MFHEVVAAEGEEELVEVFEVRLEAEVRHPLEGPDSIDGKAGTGVRAEEKPESRRLDLVCIAVAVSGVTELGEEGPEEGEVAGCGEGLDDDEVAGRGMAKAREGGGPEEEAVSGAWEAAAALEDVLHEGRGKEGHEGAEGRVEVVVRGAEVTEDAAEIVDDVGGGGGGGRGRGVGLG